MRPETIEKLCCPFDKSDLHLTIIAQDTDKNVQEGFFLCSDCKRIYPIVKGIPILNPDEYREFRLEQPLLERWKDHLPGETIDHFRINEKAGFQIDP